jgi:hypothetical protein
LILLSDIHNLIEFPWELKGVGAFWQIRIWALDKKLFTGFIYSSQYTTKLMFHTPGNFCNYRIFELLLFKKIRVRIKLFEFDKLWEIFENTSEHYKKMAYFFSNFYHSICFKSTKKILQMATWTFCVGDHIFFICYLKNHMTFFWDFGSKLFGNDDFLWIVSFEVKLRFGRSPSTLFFIQN